MQAVSVMARDRQALPEPAELPLRLRSRERLSLGLALLKHRVKEYLTLESTLFKGLTGLAGYAAARVFGALGQKQREFLLLSKLHRANCLKWVNARAERLVQEAAAAGPNTGHPIRGLYEHNIETVAPTPRSAPLFEDPTRLLKALALVLKSPASREKGVLVLLYSHTFPLFARFFNLHRIAERYHIVLEPDWSGFCDPNILAYSALPFPIFIQAPEPRDAEFLTRTCPNLVVVPTGNNWWIDHRLIVPAPDAKKDIDVAMNAGWGAYKRHVHFFAVLRKLKDAGHELRILLIGYPIDLTREDVLRQAAYFGVENQVELHESVKYECISTLLSRAKVNVLWSRKEGSNRAILEAMLTDVPCILREGHNYGYNYAYVNSQTGCYASESNLPERLLWMVQNHQQFAPRKWVLSHMSCQRATDILSKTIGRVAIARGEPWTDGLAVKLNHLHGMTYWNTDDSERFEQDYAFLRSMLGTPIRQAA
jgi:glycosyltransferase involved in cell wall biosynthesis